MDNQLKIKIQQSVLDMMKQVKFDKKNHIYTDMETGKWLQGVSEVSNIVPKNWLSAWGAKETVKFLGYSDYNDKIKAEEMLYRIKVMGLREYCDLLYEAKGASFRKSKEALVDGSAGHDWLEKFVKAKIRGNELPAIPEDNLKRPIEQFLEWEKENIGEWILSEARVAYPEKGYAGTLDGMAFVKDGSLALIDFKFASHVSEDYFLQTAGYAWTFEPYEINIDKRIVIRLPKTLETDKYDKKTRTYSKVPNNIEVKEVNTPYEEDKIAFLNALKLKSWINKYHKK